MSTQDENGTHKFKSLYSGYEEAARLLKPLGQEAAAASTSSPSGIPFTRLLDDVMPGVDRAAQVKRWNEVTRELWTVGDAEGYRLHDQTFVKVARMNWESGLDRERSAVVGAAEVVRPDVSLRKLLVEVVAAPSAKLKRDWGKWLKDYNRMMGTNHPSVDVMVSAEEAERARQIIPAMKGQAKATGGQVGLKSPEAKKNRLPRYGR